jgi:hypothetical protein
MTITQIVNNLHIVLNDFPIIDGDCYIPYAKVFADGSFELVVTWNLRVNIFTIGFTGDKWAIRTEKIGIDNDREDLEKSFYSVLRALRDFIKTIPMSEVE